MKKYFVICFLFISVVSFAEEMYNEVKLKSNKIYNIVLYAVYY